jgi:hypothetical protein
LNPLNDDMKKKAARDVAKAESAIVVGTGNYVVVADSMLITMQQFEKGKVPIRAGKIGQQ